MKVDAAAAPRPQTGNGAHQRALSGAGFTGNKNTLTGLDHHFRLPDDSGAVVQRDRQFVQAEHRIALGFAALDAVDAITGFGALQTVNRHHQRRDAPRASVPFGKARIIVHQPAERGLHDRECRGRLHDLSQRHASFQKLRGAEQDRNHRRNQARSLRYNGGAHMLPANSRPLPQNIAERLVDSRTFFLFAAEQCDAFAVFTHAGQRVAILRFSLVLALGYGNKIAADDHHRAAGDRRIHDGRDHEEAREW